MIAILYPPTVTLLLSHIIKPTRTPAIHVHSNSSASDIDQSPNTDYNSSSAIEESTTSGSYNTLSVSTNTVFQTSASHLGLPTRPVLQEGEGDNELEVMLLIRHFTEVVGT